ncbi:MAG: peroxide stress protein YaaA [Pseudomonadota bacterium]
MIILLSPAKTLDFDAAVNVNTSTEPQFNADAAKLIRRLKKLSASELRQLMKLSPALATLNVDRYRAWRETPVADATRPALFAFKGDVYLGLDAATLSKRDVTWAQRRLRILSGLYGVLRPLDLMQPYRLEMGTRLANERGSNLYDFWQERVTQSLAESLQEARPSLCVNLASNEYFGAVDVEALPARTITPRFLDYNRGDYRFLSFYAKRARGLMARWIIQSRTKSARGLLRFDVDGYRYSADHSTKDAPTFIRDPQQ